ncbi:acyl-CoA N-acyltransferase [Gongronella butleri]|nr:acyl-CoA N-acyltransferase [Gongronella butleri]
MEPEQPPHPAQVQVPDFDRWACNTTEVMQLGLVSPSPEDPYNLHVESFQPEFTYPLFGMHETAFGYKDLAINIQFAAGSLRTFVEVTSSAQYQPPSSSSSTLEQVPIDDISGTLKKYLPPDTTTNYDAFFNAVKADHEAFKPMGQLMHTYHVANEDGGEDTFEVYKCSFKDHKFREFHRRMQFFVLLFIEGSSFIEEDDEKWEIYTVFKVDKASASSVTYAFVGYCTAYPFYCWLDQIRLRISQFLVLPPYQGQGHGTTLYDYLYDVFSKRKEVCEITVEDPNDSFCDMRDKCDLRHLVSSGALNDVAIPVTRDIIEPLQHKFKLTSRQIQTCIELHLLAQLNKSDKKAYKAYRLQVKQRLYKFNYDALQDMEEEEMQDKLHQTYMGVEQDYQRILERA